MKKFLSILLTVVMLLQTAALAAPQAVTIGDSAVEVPVVTEDSDNAEEEAELAASITVYSQLDSRWADHPYGYSNTAGTVKATIGSGGCGILALVNAIYYLNGNFIQPEDLADWSVKNGHRVNGVGTAHSLYPAYAKAKGDKFGFNCTSSTGDTSTSNLSKHLKGGGVVVASSTTVKTGGGHVMAIVDYDSDSKKFLILDSYKSSNRFSATYSWQTINSSTLTTGNGNVKFKKFIYITPKVPSTPTISGHSGETSTSVKIKWSAVSGATKYKLEYRPAGGEWDADGISKTVTGTSYEATGLNSGKLYWFRLYAINDAGSSGKSEQYGVYLDGPSPQTEIVSTTSIKITWPHVGGNTEYELRYKKSGDSADQWVSVSGKFSKDEREYIHTGLEPGTQYYYKTKAYNLDDESVISDYTTDNSGFTKLNSPTVTSNASNSVSIKWERGTMNDDYTYTYRVLRKASYEAAYNSMTVVSSKSYTDTTVKPNTEYRYYIDVLRNGDSIVHSDVVTVTTPSCSHTYSSWTTTKAATCTASGSKTRTCTKCSAKETGTISAIGHSYSSWTTTTAATCTTAGVSTRTCSNCSAKETRTIAGTGHSLSEWSVKTEATCLADGEKTRHCTKSGCAYNEIEVIKAFGSHDYVEVERVEPTNVDGYVKYTCANCNDSYTEVIPAVVVSVTNVSLDKTDLNMEIGKTETLVATITPENATVKDVKWISSDEAVATVVDGLVTAIGEGNATITIMTADGRKTATCTVTVTKPEEEEPDTPVVPEEPAEHKATMVLSDVSGKPGDTVKVVVSLRSDVEINTIGLKDITYDDSILTFVGFSDYEALESNSLLSSFDEEKLVVVAALKDTQIFDGEICTLNFIINEDAEECEVAVNAVANIKLSHDTVVTDVAPATVTVLSQILGDLNHDEYVDMNDAVLLLQHSMFPELYPIEYNGSVDFTRDGYVDMNDAVLLLQYSMFPELYPIEK